MNTVQKSTTGLYKEKGSKFLSYLYPVQNENDIERHLEQIRSLHPKSRHVCYAYRMGMEGEEFRTNDDGEPNNSAGTPILNQLKSAEITNALITVVRYFGGTKLGLGGLTRAYKESAKLAIEKAILIKYIQKFRFRLVCQLNNLGLVERKIAALNIDMLNNNFEANCQFELEAPLELRDEIISNFNHPDIEFFEL